MKTDPELAALLKTLRTSLRRLKPEPEQGRIARRNARAAVHGSLRVVRGWVDKHYPLLKPLRKPPLPEVCRKSPARTRVLKRRAARRAGLVGQQLNGDIFAKTLTFAGVRFRKLTAEDGRLEIYAPPWALAILRGYADMSKAVVELRRLKKNRPARLAFEAACRLKGTLPS